MRGGFNNPPADDDDCDADDYINHIFWFGCQENSGVSANSDIAVEFFRELRSVANPADGSVILPNDMQYWNPGDNGNILFKIKNPLKLIFDDWTPVTPAVDSTLPPINAHKTEISPEPESIAAVTNEATQKQEVEAVKLD